MICLNFALTNAGVYSYCSCTPLRRSQFLDLNYCYNCLDIDECSTSVCGPKAPNNCTNFLGSYKCACGEGYTGNDKGCAGRPYLKK